MKKPRDWLINLRGSMTQQEVANKAKINRAFYTQIETGERNPSVLTAKKIATVLGFNWTLFFEYECNEMKHCDKPKTKTG